jgi:4'-phosphopantetheinyl transferase EntD
MVAVSVAQNEAVEPLGLDAEQREISHQDLRGVTEVEEISRCRTRVAGFEMQRQAPLTS